MARPPQRRDPPSDYAVIQLAGRYTLARIEEGAEPTPQMEMAWYDFHARYAPMLRRFVLTCGARHEDCDDCVQNAWGRIIVRLHRFKVEPDRAGFRTWLFNLASNAVSDFYRRQSRQGASATLDGAEIATDTPDPEAALRLAEKADRFRAAVQELKRRVSPLNFSLFLLQCLGECPASDVVDSFTLTPQQVKYRVYRTKKTFSEILEACGGADYWLQQR